MWIIKFYKSWNNFSTEGLLSKVYVGFECMQIDNSLCTSKFTRNTSHLNVSLTYRLNKYVNKYVFLMWLKKTFGDLRNVI